MINYNLYLHLSFDGKLAKLIKPRLPATIDSSSKGEYPEPDIPRICLSPTIRQCFLAIYPNIHHYFTEKFYPYMDFYLYRPKTIAKDSVVTTEELTNKRYVHDAHVTGEIWLTRPTRFVLIDRVRVFNTNSSKGLYYHPFNKPSLPLKYLAPKSIRYETLGLP